MCGIAGYYGEGNNIILDKMIDSVSYRGPDDRGVFTEGNIGLAHRRLSIVDLSPNGHQPMSNGDGTVWIVFNGEIYNHKTLRSELEKKYIFKSNSDTEVIIHLYEEIGEEVFSRIQGMFSIALYDKKKKKLYLARDRMGKKPLYWSVSSTGLIFGSELKVLLNHPAFKKDIDMESLNRYFAYEYIPTPHSIFKNTYKLEPGYFLSWDGISIKKTIFWEPTFLPKQNNFDNSLKELDSKLFQSVKDRLVADVPVGVFLSGGLDSSTIAYYAKRAGQKVKTFSIGFEEASFDESSYAREVAHHLGTEHYEKILSIDDGIKIVSKIGECLDEPMADSSILPTYLLSQFTREYVTVVLGGDGGDELFCGYDTFLAHRLAWIYEKIPKSIRNKIIEPVVRRLPTSFVNMSLDFKLKKFVLNFGDNKKNRDQRWMGGWSKDERKKLFNQDVYNKVNDERVYGDVDSYLSKVDSKDFFDELTLLYQRMYMMDEVLVKVDRASMMNSLEARAPFLDTRVVDLANHMPVSFKLRGLERKYILKKLMEDKLPKNIVYRKKKGFGVPIGEWFRGDLKPLVLDYLNRESLKKIGIFNVEYVEEVLSQHFDGKKDNKKQIWSLLIFAMWWRKWLQ